MPSRSVLVVAAHPDDEALGCGATIAKHSQDGDEVHVLILAEGVTSRDEQRDRDKHVDELSALAHAAKTFNDILGVASLTLHDFPDNRMDSVDRLDIIKVVEKFITEHEPEVIYTHHVGDLNIDHRRVHEAVVTACRPVPDQKVRTLLFFEIASSTEWSSPGAWPAFVPNWFVDVTSTIQIKLRALEAYQSEMQSWPHVRSIQAVEHLARWRGATVGVEVAEAFILGRQIN